MQKRSRHLTVLALALAMAGTHAGAAQAADADGLDFAFRGFGTVGATRSSTDDAQFVATSAQGSGADRSIDLGVDSKLGLQGTLRYGQRLSATLQVLSKRNVDDNFTPAVEWGFVQYAPVTGLSLRAGRMGAPLFMVSDYRDVGYATPWMRPPVEVYGSAPVSHFDGVDALYRKSFGDTTVATQALFGQASQELRVAGGKAKVEIDNMTGLNVTAERGAFTLRTGYFVGKVDLRADAAAQLVSALRAVAPMYAPAAALAGDIEIAQDDISFFGVGAMFDDGTWLVQGEFTRVRADGGGNANWDAGYATVGRRFGRWLPTVTWSSVTPKVTLDNTIPAAGPLAPLAAGVGQFLRSASYKQDTLSLALRYDVYKNVALKGQFDRVSADRVTNLLRAPTPSFDGRADVVSVGVDFVF